MVDLYKFFHREIKFYFRETFANSMIMLAGGLPDPFLGILQVALSAS